MGAMTYENFVTELTFLLANRTDADATNTTRIDRWINQAYTYMCHPSVHHFREMQAMNTIALVNGQNEYDIATIGGDTPVALRWLSYIDATVDTNLANKRKLKPRGIRWFESRTLTSSRPFLFTIDGTNLIIAGVPGPAEVGKLLRVGYTKEPDLLVATATTVINRYYDRPLLKFIQAFAEADLGMRAQSLITLKEAMGTINNAAEKNELEAEDTGFETEMILQPAMGF
jgi:hypothetical protein